MKRYLKVFLVIGVLALGYWYFVQKEEDYQISFTSSQPKAVIYNHILKWKEYSKEDISAIALYDKEPYNSIVQNITIKDSLFSYQWELNKTEDGKTRVTAHITDLQNSFIQRIQAPFVKNDFVKRSIKNVQNIGEALKINSQKFKVHSLQEDSFNGGHYAYVSLESPIDKKATTMLQNISLVMDYVNENEMKLNGPPVLEVTSWNQKGNLIQFDFCFPILKTDSLPSPKNPLVQFKEIPTSKALKVEFNGNYRISSNAWYYLEEHAQQNDLKTKNLPIEVFLNDPHEGGDPLQWKAHIFLPLED